jgi:hypothetical protein
MENAILEKDFNLDMIDSFFHAFTQVKKFYEKIKFKP